MVVVMAEGASEEQIQNVVAHLTEQGFDVHRSTGAQRTVLGAVGQGRHRDPRLLEVLDGVAADVERFVRWLKGEAGVAHG